jgi:GDP-L-fucose synthase
MEALRKKDKIYVSGHTGMVGRAICQALERKGYYNVLTVSREELDLSDDYSVASYLEDKKPDVVFLAAAKVGGIVANDRYGADFIYENLKIQNNVMWNAHKFDVRRLIFLGSSCIYPKFSDQPIKENALLSGKLELTNRPYALAKIAGLELISSLRQQYERDYFSVMPTNLYGPGDNFDLETSHVLPALIRRFHEAKLQNAEQVTIWGTGQPYREFLYAPDCANAIVHLAETLGKNFFEKTFPYQNERLSHINVGTGSDIQIKDLAQIIREVVGFQGDIAFDTERPDGTPRKRLDTSILSDTGWKPAVALEEGIRLTYRWFLDHVNN